MLLPGPRPASRLVPLLAVVGLAITSPPGVRDAAAKGDGKGDATAEREPDETAAEFDRLGKAAYKQQKWDDAIAAFEGAYAADPLPRFLYNLGRCHEKKNNLARASHFFEQYLDRAPEAKDANEVRVLAKMLRIKLEKTSSKVVVTADHDDALVQVFAGEEPVKGASPLSYWLPFGSYRVLVEKVGFAAWDGAVVVTPDKTAEVRVHLEPVVAAGAGASGPSGPVVGVSGEPPASSAGEGGAVARVVPGPPPAAAEAPSGLPGWLAPATVGLGVTLLAGGGVFGWLSGQAVDDRDASASRSWDESIPYSEYRSAEEATDRNVLRGWVRWRGPGGLVGGRSSGSSG